MTEREYEELRDSVSDHNPVIALIEVCRQAGQLWRVIPESAREAAEYCDEEVAA